MSEKEPTLEDQLTNSILEVEKIAKKINKHVYEIMPFIQLRELMIIKQQLYAIHEHLDMIEERVQKTEKTG